jgi:hypothetical protein
VTARSSVGAFLLPERFHWSKKKKFSQMDADGNPQIYAEKKPGFFLPCALHLRYHLRSTTVVEES